ncbi:MAG: Ig-like domain-containing protein [Paludibacter sp.]
MKRILLSISVMLITTLAFSASVTFNKVYPGTGSSYDLNSSSISWTTPVSGSSFKFTSVNPADQSFSGNNVAGQLTYTSGSMNYAINGVISRKVGNKSNISAFYFVQTTVLGGNTVTGKAWLLIVPDHESSFSDNSSEKTNSAPVNDALNNFLDDESSNYPPVITSNGGGSNAYISIPENTTAVTTVTSTDQNVGDTKTYTISGGVDASKFSINSTTGVLTFVSAPNYENPTDVGLDNVYNVQVTVTDSKGATDNQSIAVTVTNLNDNSPVINSNGGGATATVGVTAGSTFVTTVSATDADFGDVISYSITGGANAGLFSINPSTGSLSFKSAAAVGSYVLTVTAMDSAGNTDTQIIMVNVTQTDTTAPTLAITSSDNNLSAGEVCTISFKFSERVQGFTYSDVSVAGGTLGAISQSAIDPTLYTASFTQSGATAPATFNVAAGTYQDLAGNNGSAASLSIACDLVAPTVAVSFSYPDIAYGETDLVTFTFSENPGNSFTVSDIDVTNATISSLMPTADPKVWNATVQQVSAISAPIVTVRDKSYTDLAGNPGSSATATIPIVPPSIDLANNPTSDTGFSYTDNITTNRKPVLEGYVDSQTATVTVKVQYYVGETLTTLTYNNVSVNAQHTFSLNLSTVSPSSGSMPSAGLPEGYISLLVTTPSGATSSNRFLIDLTAPSVPTVVSQTTYDQTPTITGTATVADGDVLTVTVNGHTYTTGDGNLILNGTAWTLNIPSAYRITPGTYNVTATTTDAAGNATSDVTSNELTISASTLTIDLANNSTDDTGISSTDNITSNRKPVINGTAVGSDATVKVTVVSGSNTYTYNSVPVSSGAWSLNLATATPSSITPTGIFPVDGLASGTVNLTVEGNTSGAMNTNSFVIDYTAPVIPTVNFLTTIDNTPSITGTATIAAGDVFTVTVNGITYTNGDGRLSYSSGTWTLNIPDANALPVATYTVVARVTDPAGNSSVSTTSNQLTILPETQTYNITATPTFTTANIGWSNGSRTSRIVFIKEGSGAISNPVNGTTYSASTNWTSKGTQLASSGYYCIYKGTGSSVKVTGLYPGRLYTIQAFEHNGSTGSENYLTSVSGANNPATVTPWPSTTFTNSQGVTSAEAWSTSGRWDHDTIPSAALHPAVLVYIDGNCEVTNTAVSQNLTINAVHGLITPKLTIDASKQLNVIGLLTNNSGAPAILVKASTTLPNGTLTWGSGNPFGSVEMHSKAYINLSNPLGSRYNWQFFGIPVKTFQYQNLEDDSTCDSELIREWDESVIDYNNVWVQRNDGSSLYVQPTDIMTQNKGYEFTHCSPKIHTFRGELLDTDFNKSLSYSPTAVFAGQNIFGNPYTAGIDISKISFGANTEQSVYLFNTGTYNDWLTTGGQSTPGNGPGQYTVSTPGTAGHNGVQGDIPSMQGFLVKATGPGSTIAISKPTGLMSNSTPQRVKGIVNSSSELTSTRIDLIGDHFTDRMWIFSNPTCTRRFDNGWDGKKLLGDTKVSQLYSIENDGNYQINAVSDMNESVIGFQPGVDTNFKLVFNHENATSVYAGIYLVDLFANKTVDISESGSEYSFTASPTDITKRFKIITQSTGLVQPSDKQNSKLRLYNTEDGIYIENLSNISATFTLYNVAGKVIQVSSVNENSTKTINTKQLVPGIYIAKSETNSITVTQRFIIK